MRQSSPIDVSVHLVEQRRSPGPEVDRRHVDRFEDARAVRRDELAVVRGREHADPRVEELDHVRSCVHLLAHVAREAVRERRHQPVPRMRLAVHERLHLREVAARLAFDQIARHGERCAAEADDGAIVVELGRARSGSPRRPRARPRRERAAAPASNESTTGPTPSTSCTSTPIATTGVMMSAKITAASTPCRRTGCSVTSAQSSGRAAELEEVVPLAQRPVLGQRATRLAHEPHRRPLDGLAPRGAHEQRLGHSSTAIRSSSRLNVNAPSASATTAAHTRYTTSTRRGALPAQSGSRIAESGGDTGFP